VVGSIRTTRLRSWPAERFDAAVFARVAAVTQERVAVLGEVPELVGFLFTEDAPVDEASWEKAVLKDETAPAILTAALAAYAECPWTVDELHRVTLEIAESLDKKLGKAQAPIRVAVMGASRGLPLFDSLEVLGRDETRRRISAALDRITPSS
jgi:glutamyl-tRNA synthetase